MRIRASFGAVFAIAGFLTVVAASGVEETRRAAQSRREGLVRLIRERQEEVEQLGETLVNLRTGVLGAQRRLSEEAERAARRIRRVQLRAGATALAGPGLVVKLSPSRRKAVDPVEEAAFTIHDVDLQLVVNGLWTAGAEAIAVNGQRLVATSPIRAAGETITVNFRPLVPPYEVLAIGPDQEAFEATGIVRRFRRWVADFGLGFQITRRDRVEVPAYVGTLQLSSARVDDPAS